MKESFDPNLSPPGGAYSPALRFRELVFLAGQGPFDPATGEILGTTIEEQTEATVANIDRLLAAAGASLATALKTTVFLADFAYFDRYDAVYAARFPEPRPVRTTVAANLGGILIEIDVIAYSEASDAR